MCLQAAGGLGRAAGGELLGLSPGVWVLGLGVGSPRVRRVLQPARPAPDLPLTAALLADNGSINITDSVFSIRFFRLSRVS